MLKNPGQVHQESWNMHKFNSVKCLYYHKNYSILNVIILLINNAHRFCQILLFVHQVPRSLKFFQHVKKLNDSQWIWLFMIIDSLKVRIGLCWLPFSSVEYYGNDFQEQKLVTGHFCCFDCMLTLVCQRIMWLLVGCDNMA